MYLDGAYDFHKLTYMKIKNHMTLAGICILGQITTPLVLMAVTLEQRVSTLVTLQYVVARSHLMLIQAEIRNSN